jgi:hypothetical protein
MIFLVDTSVMTSQYFRPLVEASAKHGHKVEVPALVYAERLFQLRRRRKGAFDPAEIRLWFDRFPTTLSVPNLDPVAAESLAAALYARFPDDAAWLSAKRDAWRRCLGHKVTEEPGANRQCGASVDLYILGLASPERPVVTKDGGPEWKGWPAGTVLRYTDAMKRAESP